MNLNTDAVQNVKHKIIRWESGYAKTAAEIAQGAGILSPDNYYSGIVAEMEVGTTVACLDFLAYGNTANALVLADATDATLPCMAIALEASVDGGMVKVLLYGYLKSADLLFGAHAFTTATWASTYVVADNEYIQIDGVTYEWTVDGTVTEGNIALADSPVGVGIYVEALAMSTLIAAVLAQSGGKITGVVAGHTIVFTATGYDIAATGNAITSVASGVALVSVTAATFAGGVNGTTIFLSDTAGDHSLVTGTKTQTIGRSLSLHELMFNPDPYIEE